MAPKWSCIHFGANMPNLSIKDVPEAWAQALRLRAARNHRSLQSELMALIQGAVAPEFSPLAGTSPVSDRIAPELADSAPANPGRRGSVVGFDRFGHPIVRHGWKTVEQIATGMRAQPGGPVQCRALPKGVDIIREERDAR
jgi:plasmid stability protein